MTTVATPGMLFCSAPPMKRLRLSLFALGVLVTVVLVSACGRREPPAPPAATISRHLAADPPTLDPITMLEEESARVAAMMFRPLISIDKELKLVPGLAKSWSVSDDGLVYEFHLDPAATWEDGKPVTSDDVRFTVERIHDPKANAANWSWGFEDLAGIETPDPATVRVRFQKPYSERILAFVVPIVSASAYGRAKPGDVDRHPVGSGPYRLASWDSNRTIRLTRRPDAPADKYPFDEVVFRIIPDDSTRFQAGGRGDLDEFKINRDQRKATEGMPDFLARVRVLKVQQPIEVVLIWNVKHPFLSDARVRRALAHAWPREETARQLYVPDGAALVSGPYPAGRCRRMRPTSRRPGTIPPRARGSWTRPAGSPGRTASGARAAGRRRSISCSAPNPASRSTCPRFSGAPTRRSASSSCRFRSTWPSTRSADRTASSTRT